MSRPVAVMTTLLAVALIAGCGGTVPMPRLVWPDAPAPPRVEYVNSFQSTLQLERSFFGKLRDFVFGPPQAHALARPWGVTYDRRGRMLVADTGAGSVLAVDFRAGKADRWKSLGPQGQLLQPINVIAIEDAVFVADAGLGRVVVLDLDGRFQRYLTEEGILERPIGLDYHAASGTLFVTDSAQHEVFAFGLDGSLRRQWGRRGDERGEFHYPLGVAVSEDERVYVVDSLHFAVQVFDLEGGFQFSFGAAADSIGTMVRPRGIDFDSAGHVYVTDALLHEVQVYDREGTLLLRFGAPGHGAGQFQLPAGLWIDPLDQIHVVDSINGRVQTFQYLPLKNEEDGR